MRRTDNMGTETVSEVTHEDRRHYHSNLLGSRCDAGLYSEGNKRNVVSHRSSDDWEFGVKGGRFRAFCRWLKRDYDGFWRLLDRTTLARQLVKPQYLTDSFPVELLFPIRQGRSARPLGTKTRIRNAGQLGSKYVGIHIFTLCVLKHPFWRLAD